MLMDGFKKELGGRLEVFKSVRAELENHYSKRIPDEKVDSEENADYKEKCMITLRNAEAAMTNYAGSVRSIKGVVESCLI